MRIRPLQLAILAAACAAAALAAVAAGGSRAGDRPVRTVEAATTYAFPAGRDGRPVEFACHLPGHYACGMRGTVLVGGSG